MEHALEPDGLAGLDSERHDVLDLEVDRLADAHTVPDTVVEDIEGGSFDAQHLADEWRQGGHGAAEPAGEHPGELVSLLLACLLVDEEAELPVPVGHHLRRV